MTALPLKPPRSFSTLFILVTLTNMLSETMNIYWLQYGSKPLIMGLLFLFVWPYYRRADFPSSIRWLLAGIIFALLGDVFLMIRDVDLFAPGLGFFLLMQLCYCRVFWLYIRQSGRSVSFGKRWKTGLLFLLYGAVFLIILYPVLSGPPALKLLWWPVVGYTACLSTMGFLATQVGTFRLHGLRSQGSIFLGALLFILSDSAIAIDKFLYPIPGSTWLVMSTYAAAQYFIVVGVLNKLELPAVQKVGMAHKSR